ncbi:class I SAM-dependent methyltransferase [Methylobacterium nonmethylotrophicum]|uniref:Class I SAM-dependent methyltransferase n=1 Tax=Methylobacterium nonmethylotrophicum TaxID=1141884 RepID=A0A4Z0NWM2_9HYPH|nr:class I SAM-dependent methyltransferase [Methylobacterium nonmethylotrophicum]TGE02328.1 class I SAM-dependent methyltransferase [Methylobacterium nonmethylotrophicum]
MSADAALDRKYYEAAAPRSLGERLTAAARDRIYADFLRLARPGPDTTLLDIGVSDVVNDAANVLERRYPHPHRITAAGLGTAEDFRTAHPAVAYRQIAADCRLPFPDRSFGIATSNAVLEHVGSPDNQRLMLAEMLRVADSVFLTVPHRYFPVEHHTAIPLLHWSDVAFRLACRRLGKAEWAEERNLILMTRARLAALVPPGRRARIGCTGLPLGPFSSNLYLHVEALAP